jgi:hypothetical protein
MDDAITEFAWIFAAGQAQSGEGGEIWELNVCGLTRKFDFDADAVRWQDLYLDYFRMNW